MKILHLEDSKSDARLIAGLLKMAEDRVEISLVDSRSGYEAALDRADFDIILSDYSMPGFDGLSALEMARRCHPDKPFIFVSGSIGEERAVEALKLGAADYVIKDRPGRLVFAVRQAVERRREEERNRRRQRVESIGVMAGGIAHDLGNVLTPILMTAQLLQNGKPAESLKLANLIEESAKHGSDLVQQLLAFARGAETRRVEIQVNQQINRLQTILRPALGGLIRLELSFPETPWPILADPTQFDQVMMNLCLNARDAMPDGGRIEISAKNLIVDGRYVRINVTDTGSGIAPEIIARIFEPFFTTKARDRGNGLGLATVSGIVKGHGGFLRVESKVGEGTSFYLHFPAEPAAAVWRPTVAVNKVTPSHRRRSIPG